MVYLQGSVVSLLPHFPPTYNSYVSFVEIFSSKSIKAFIANGATDAEAVRYATGCFFLGIVVVYILDAFVHGITALAGWIKQREMKTKAVTSLKRLLSRKSMAPSTAPGETMPVDTIPAVPACSIADPELGTRPDTSTHGGQVGSTADAQSYHHHDHHHPCTPPHGLGHLAHRVQQAMCTTIPSPPSSAADTIDAAEAAAAAATAPADGGPTLPVPRDPDVLRILQDDHHQAALMKTGVLTAIAIFGHNFPEGLATFVATLADPSVGVSVAVAIALHNAVEGVCVALPIYYATGSKWKVLGGGLLFWGCCCAWAFVAVPTTHLCTFACTFVSTFVHPFVSI